MPITLSTENVPERVVRRLKRVANQHHRSLQDELRAIIEAAAEKTAGTVMDVLRNIRWLGLSTPAEASALVRADRDSH